MKVAEKNIDMVDYRAWLDAALKKEAEEHKWDDYENLFLSCPKHVPMKSGRKEWK